MIFFNIAYIWTTFSKLYLGYHVFIFYHGLCVGGYGAKDGVGVGSTSGVVLDHLPTSVKNTLINGIGYYGIDLTESKVRPTGAFTLKCIEILKGNRKASSITKFYACNMDTMVATICMMCNVNKSELCYRYVTSFLLNLQFYFEFIDESSPSKLHTKTLNVFLNLNVLELPTLHLLL
jgi:hypothetical protein